MIYDMYGASLFEGKQSSLTTIIKDLKENGFRQLSAQQKQFLADNDIELVTLKNTDTMFYFVMPCDSQLLMDEQMHRIVAAETASAGTAASAGSMGTVFSVIGGSSASSLGSIGTAGTAGTVNVSTASEVILTDEDKENAPKGMELLANLSQDQIDTLLSSKLQSNN